MHSTDHLEVSFKTVGYLCAVNMWDQTEASERGLTKRFLSVDSCSNLVDPPPSFDGLHWGKFWSHEYMLEDMTEMIASTPSVRFVLRVDVCLEAEDMVMHSLRVSDLVPSGAFFHPEDMISLDVDGECLGYEVIYDLTHSLQHPDGALFDQKNEETGIFWKNLNSFGLFNSYNMARSFKNLCIQYAMDRGFSLGNVSTIRYSLSDSYSPIRDASALLLSLTN